MPRRVGLAGLKAPSGYTVWRFFIGWRPRINYLSTELKNATMTNGNIDLGLLVLRLWFGLEMALAHGLPKLIKLINGESFADPLGVGMTTSLVLAIFGEFVCGLLIAAGFFTRMACIPFMITMLVAALIVHSGEGWGKIASPLMYVVGAIVLLITGPGRYSLDHRLFVAKTGKVEF
jgi:putative oxidoreductase